MVWKFYILFCEVVVRLGRTLTYNSLFSPKASYTLVVFLFIQPIMLNRGKKKERAQE